MPEPLAVAYIDVRPTVGDFRTETEREVQQQLASDPVEIAGQVKLGGLDAARRDVARLGDEFSQITGQLQFEGLDEATAGAQELQRALEGASSVSVEASFQPLLQDVRALREEARLLAAQLQGLPEAVGSIPSGAAAGLADELGAASDAAANLDAAAGESGQSLSDLSTTASFLRAASDAAANAERRLATATAEEAAQTRRAIVEEERLIRVRAGRSRSIAGFRLAGAGLLVGTALFSATRAIGSFADALEVAGEAENTVGGRFRNFAANTIRGDLVGAFGALTSQTREFTAAQLELINQTPELERALRALGAEGDLLASRLAALEQISSAPVPQFIQTQVARAQAAGDEKGEARGLEAAEQAILDAIGRVPKIQADQRELADEVRRLTVERQRLIREIAGASADEGVAAGQASRRGSGSRLGFLQRELEDLTDEMNDAKARLNEVRGPANAALESLFKELTRTRAERKRLADQEAGASSENPFAGLEAAAERARVSGDLRRYVAALQREAVAIADTIADLITSKGGSAQLVQSLRDQLAQVNRDYRDALQDIADEEQRHRQAVIDVQVGPSVEAAIRADIAGDPAAQIAALREQRAVFERALQNKNLTQAEVNGYLSKIQAIDGQIESIQAGVAAEEQRHRDAARTARQEAHQAVLDSLGGQEAVLQNNALRAALTEGLADEIAAQEDLRDFYLQQSRNQDLTVSERRAYTSKLLSARAEIRGLREQERQARAQEVQERLDDREDALRDALAIARTTDDTTRDDERRLRALVAFYRKQSQNQDLSVSQRRDFLVKQKQTEKELRDLRAEEERSGTTLADLFRQQVGIAGQAGFDLGPQVAGQVTQPIEDEVTKRLRAQVDVRGRIDPATEKRVTSEEQLIAAIDRLTQAIVGGAAAGVTGGTPAPRDARAAAAEANARYYQSLKAKKLAEETASA